MTGPTIITSDKTTSGSLANPRFFTPLRQDPLTPDPQVDPQLLEFMRRGWSFFDDLVRLQNRQIEENVRMISGQHHSIYHPAFGRWLDLTEWMSAEEREWRARPIINKLLPWFITTHARATENTPILTFVPGPDRSDAELAEVMDLAFKAQWYETNMEDVHDRLMGWVIVAGRGHLQSRIDQQGGSLRKWVGSGMVPMIDANDRPVDDGDGGQAHQMLEDGVRFDQSGKPLTSLRVMPDGGQDLVHAGEAHSEPVGSVKVDVLAPPQVRGSWGPDPWYQKRVHYVKKYLTPEQVWDHFNVDVEPDIRGGDIGDIGELERLLYGTGFFGSASNSPETQAQATNTDGFVEVTERWESPSNLLPRQGDSPGGRWTVCSRRQIIRDGARPVAFPYTSNLNTFEFVRIPGRPGGTTPQESLNPIQRDINDGHGRIKEHVNLSTNPKGVIDAASGLLAKNFTNRPGQNYVVPRRPGVPAIEFVSPPSLGADVYKRLELLGMEFDAIGFTQGAQDLSAPGDSGEKVKEVRFNTDRFLGPTMRRVAGEYGRMAENWQAMFPLIWDMETVIHYAGDDNIARTMTVYPEMWKSAKCNVRPDVESMLPEGRGEKQERAVWAYSQGLFGLPGSPEAVSKFWEMAHMPHLSRFSKPGGIHVTTAEQENGQILQGVPAMQIPVFEWYDDMAHLSIHERFMSSPEFKKLDPAVQNEFVLHRQAHQFNAQTKMAKAVMQQSALQNALTPPGAGPGGAPGRPGQPSGDKAGPGGPVRPPLPTPPAGGAPGGAMPTLAGAPPVGQ